MQANKVLHKLLMNTCVWMHKTRRESLAENVLAALFGTRLTVTDLGRSIHSHAKQKHCIKRADRLLSNPHLHSERVDVYAAVTRFLIGHQQRPVIIVDWSDMDAFGRHYLLRASIPVNGRAITLYEEVHTVKTKEKPKTLLVFLQALQAMLPANCAINGEEPVHVHVERDTNIAKFWIDPVRLQSSGGFRRPEIARILRVIKVHQSEIVEAWNEYFSR